MIIMNHKDRLQSLWFYNCLPILKKIEIQIYITLFMNFEIIHRNENKV